MNKYAITVIVPVFNGEKYVESCINQLLKQTLKDIEVIFIDDGSVDNTYNLLEVLTANYDNFKVIHQSNGGVSNARNTGISISSGQYIGFVDVDDSYDNDMFEILYNEACKNNLDIISMDNIGNYNSITIFDNKVEAIKNFLNSRIGMSACYKIFRRTLFEHCKFPEGTQIYEDCYVVYYSLKNSERIGVINVNKYHYIRREGSNSRASRFERKYFDAINVVNEICADAININSNLIYDSIKRKAKTYLRIVKIYYLRGEPKEYESEIENLKSWLRNIPVKDRHKYFKKFDAIRYFLLMHCLPMFKFVIKFIDCK